MRLKDADGPQIKDHHAPNQIPKFTFAACSGARMEDMVLGKQQLAQLDKRTTLVTMQAGGYVKPDMATRPAVNIFTTETTRASKTSLATASSTTRQKTTAVHTLTQARAAPPSAMRKTTS